MDGSAVEVPRWNALGNGPVSAPTHWEIAMGWWRLLNRAMERGRSAGPKPRAVRPPRDRHPVAESLESRRLLAAIAMTDQEQLLLELVNRARANPTAEAARFGIDLNQELEPDTISTDPKQPLAPNQMLIMAARRHADDMLNREFFEHENPDGDGPTERAHAAGYPTSVGENIAWYGAPGLLERDAEVTRRHEALFLSPPHRTNMLNRGYRELGNGIRFGEFSRLNAIMVAEEFGNRGGDYFITGVVFNDSVLHDDFYSIGESLASVEIKATRNRDGLEFQTVTGPSGGYALQVPAGVYTVTARGHGIGGTMTVNQVAMLGGNGKADFNTRAPQLGSIAGVLFADTNQNGTHDSTELLLAGRTVYLDADTDGKHDDDEMSVESDTGGNYRLSNLRPGSYIVQQVLPAGWDSTVVDDPLTVELAAAQQRTGDDVGSIQTNLAPIAQPDSFTGQAGRSMTLDVFANDHDSDGNLVLELTQIPVSPQNGTVTLNKSTGMLIYAPRAGYLGSDGFEYVVVDDGGLTSEPVHVSLTINPAVGKAWQNADQPLDVNNDEFVTPIDALLVLNVINRNGAGALSFPAGDQQPPPFLDVNGDGFVSPIDPLLVLNEINRIASERRTVSPALIAAAVDQTFAKKVLA